MNIKKGVLLFITVFLLSVSVHAAKFDVEFEAIDSTITFGQLAQYKVKIKNNMDTTEEFKVKTLDYPLWEISTEPLLNPIQLSIKPDKLREISLLINPLYVTNYGVYDINVAVELVSKKEKITTPLRVNIVSPQAGTYVETVISTILIDDEIDPTKEIPLRVRIDNQNIIEYPNLRIKVESNLINKEVEEILGKKEKKTIPLTTQIDPQTPPQEDTLIVKIMSNEKTLDTKIKKIKIMEKKEVAKEEKTERRFLKTIDHITLRNAGNTNFQEKIKIESPFIQTLFTSSNPKGEFIKEGQQRFLIIPVEISPGETLTIEITKNYITLLIIATIITIIIILYFLLRSPLTINKKATNIALKEGGVSEFKIILNISNRSKTQLKDIHIIDRIPNIADIEKGLTIGTLHPTKVLKHEKKGTIIKWNIDKLDAGDERVISYKIKSHLSIVGEFNLAQAIGKFKFKGKDTITHSNTLGISP